MWSSRRGARPASDGRDIPVLWVLSIGPSFGPGVRVSADAVSGAGHGGDDRGFAEALAQSRDRNANGVGERVGVLIPGPLQQLFGADDTSFGGDEHFEHGELLAGQRD